MMLRTFFAALLLASCAHGANPPVPPEPEAGDAADPCTIIQEIDEARLIRNPDGSAYNEPCP